MRKATHTIAVLAVLAAAGGAAMGDGMIVPVRPELRVRGHWAVKYHHVDLTVRDQVASVSIDQEFVNTGGGAIEVEYLFPVPPDAAIDSMTLMVNGKEYAAKLLKADEARRIYEGIVRQKKDPALLEYAGFGLYRTRAFPLQPGKPCKVIVTYKDVCRKDGDLVRVWYPLNTEKFSAKAIDSVKVTVDIKSGADITAVYSPTHDLNVQRKDARHVIATYQAAKTLPTTDFEVYYKAADEDVGATLLTHQPDAGKDGYFLLLVSPNPRSSAKKVVPKDVVIVFDHSGSMSGQKLRQAKDALTFVLKNLNAKDRFNVVAYNDSVEGFFESLVEADASHVAEAVDRLDRIDATGGTNIHEALQVALGQCGKGDGRPDYILFLTDGQPTVGKTKEADILTDTKKANASAARLFAFGVGYDVNVRLLDNLVEQNQGKSDYVKPKEPIEAKVASLYAKIKNPVMTDIKVKLQGVRIRDAYPRPVGDLFQGDQILLAGRYDCKDAAKLAGREGGRRTQLVVTGRYEGRQRGFEYPVTIRAAGKRGGYDFVEKLWAVRRVGYLLDQIQLHGKSQEVIDELVRLSRDYGIMTPYTSFLADETTRLDSVSDLRAKGQANADRLSQSVTGGRAHAGAALRRELAEAKTVPAQSAPPAPDAGPGDAAGRGGGGVVSYGYQSVAGYEEGRKAVVTSVRNVGKRTLYRRGDVWYLPETAKLDPKQDAEKITVIERFSDAYFALVKDNTTEENQVLAAQGPGEQLLIMLRSQVYLIR